MKMVFVGGMCKNNCFSKLGGCETHRNPDVEELSSAEVAYKLGFLFAQRQEVFLYTPDMFSDYYYGSIFQNMPQYKDFPPFISINAGVRTMYDKVKDFKELQVRGIKEVWLGVESGSWQVRHKYGKAEFTNHEVIRLTEMGNELGIHMNWYLLDSRYDNGISRQMTYQLILIGRPYRIRLQRLTEEG